MTELSPTTVEEREKRLVWMNRMEAKPIIVDRVFERRLLKDVKRLEAERKEAWDAVAQVEREWDEERKRLQEVLNKYQDITGEVFEI